MTQDAFPVFSFSQDCYSCVCHAGELPGLMVCPLSLKNTSAVWALLPPPRPSLLAISGVNWNRDLSPWPAPNVFPQEQAFSGGSRAFLSVLSERLLPEAERRLPMSPVWRGIAGYSLAGLFALSTGTSSSMSAGANLPFSGVSGKTQQKSPFSLCGKLYPVSNRSISGAGNSHPPGNESRRSFSRRGSSNRPWNQLSVSINSFPFVISFFSNCSVGQGPRPDSSGRGPCCFCFHFSARQFPPDLRSEQALCP